MKISKWILFSVILISLSNSTLAQKEKTDANIFGHVISEGKHIEMVNIVIKGTTIGTITDETGHYNLVNLPEGTLVVRAQALGFKPEEKKIIIEAHKNYELNFILEPDALGLEQVVVTADRSGRNLKESSVVVNTLTPKIFSITQSLTLSEGLQFCSGLRTENNCQNCGFNQLRMNGLEGPYSLILINGYPIFSGLAGVYGLEMIPANMIERTEIVRGGGSALYGSNAIAGTVNIILKNPVSNKYEFGLNSGITGVGVSGSGKVAKDNTLTANASMVSSNRKAGMALYGFTRNRGAFDANADGFSELPQIRNITFGTRVYHRLGPRSKITFDIFNINEKRRGGDKFDYPVHEAGIAEAVHHNISSGALTFDKFLKEVDKLSIFVSGQYVNRDSYYGANQSLSDYGKTSNLSFTGGGNYKTSFGKSEFLIGGELRGESLYDEKLGYPDLANAVIVNDTIRYIPHTENVLIVDQNFLNAGLFAQYKIEHKKINASFGMRYDHYNISDFQNKKSTIKGNVFSPRISLLYSFNNVFQARFNYSHGFRAPQIFDEDLHIETSGSRQIIHINDPGLTQETSHSIITSLNITKSFYDWNIFFLIEGFYTILLNPFVNKIGDPDQNGVVEYVRMNAEDGAFVQGLNFELNFTSTSDISIRMGFTMQKSEYEKPQEFNETRFFRTPGNYGFLTVDLQRIKNFEVGVTTTYSGSMLVPYFGPQISDPDAGELRRSQAFFDLGLKTAYKIRLNSITLKLFGGIKNIFNSYQSDFDIGINRDPGYIYGPVSPRIIYFGLKLGN